MSFLSSCLNVQEKRNIDDWLCDKLYIILFFPLNNTGWISDIQKIGEQLTIFEAYSC